MKPDNTHLGLLVGDVSVFEDGDEETAFSPYTHDLSALSCLSAVYAPVKSVLCEA